MRYEYLAISTDRILSQSTLKPGVRTEDVLTSRLSELGLEGWRVTHVVDGLGPWGSHILVLERCVENE